MFTDTSKKWATLIGYVALLFWSAGALYISSLHNIPTMEILAVAFSISFIFGLFRLYKLKDWSLLRQPPLLWIMGCLGVIGNDALYIAAFKHAPSAQVELIAWIWPVLVVLFAGLLPREKLTIRHLFAASLSFFGIYILLVYHYHAGSFHPVYLWGYLLALLDAIVWSTYTLTLRHYGKSPTEMLAVYFGIGAVLALAGHFLFEPTVHATYAQWGILLLMGITTHGLAYFFWDFGVKKGNFKLLSILSYTNPIISILLLITFGFAQPTLLLFLACFLICCGSIIGSIKKPTEPPSLSNEPYSTELS